MTPDERNALRAKLEELTVPFVTESAEATVAVVAELEVLLIKNYTILAAFTGHKGLDARLLWTYTIQMDMARKRIDEIQKGLYLADKAGLTGDHK